MFKWHRVASHNALCDAWGKSSAASFLLSVALTIPLLERQSSEMIRGLAEMTADKDLSQKGTQAS